MNIFKDPLDELCFETFEDVEKDLNDIEQILALRFKIPQHVHVRQMLITLDLLNHFEEDEVVARWHELYSRYVAW